MAVARPQPRDDAGDGDAGERADDDVDRAHLEDQRAHQERRLHALARDHQQREEKDAEPGGRALARRRLPQLPFDLALDAPRRAPHVHGQRRHRHGGDQREDAFPERLIRGARKQLAGEDAEDDRDANAPVHRRDEMTAAALPQKREADGDDEEGLEALPGT